MSHAILLSAILDLATDELVSHNWWDKEKLASFSRRGEEYAGPFRAGWVCKSWIANFRSPNPADVEMTREESSSPARQ